MGAAKKQYKKYTVEKNNKENKTSVSDAKEDKKLIEQYVKKIQQQLENDTQLQKKAAQVIEQMMNSNKKNKK
jgi:hypothetical protein